MQLRLLPALIAAGIIGEAGTSPVLGAATQTILYHFTAAPTVAPRTRA
ncbi:MAG: hypothetical protein WDN04_07235 [Rhodospirillales bacterium]